ncbi:MAG: glycosyltransferase [Nanoarchaeota archaeon]|nr:glycosyltransferase [Nanoarchaeota archaeon]
MKYKVCVIIPAYNEEELILRVLTNLSNQTVSKRKYEIIIVNNNSTDKTAGLVKKFSYKNKDLEISLVREYERGIIPSRKRGMEFAIEKNKKVKHLLLASTDADTMVSSEWIKTILKTYKNTKADFLVGDGFFKKRFWETVPNLKKWFLSSKKNLKKVDSDFVFMLGGYNFVITRTLFQRINLKGLNENSSDRIFSVNARILKAKFIKMNSINYVSPRRFVFHIRDLCNKGTYGIPLTNIRGNFEAQAKIADKLAEEGKLDSKKFIRNYLKEYLFLVLLLNSSLLEKNKKYFKGFYKEIEKIISKYEAKDYWNNLDLLLKRAEFLTKKFWKQVYENILSF